MTDWSKVPEFVAKGHANTEAQLKHVQACLRIARDEIATLEMKLDTVKLGSQLKERELERQIDALVEARSHIRLTTTWAPRKKRWWQWR